MEEPTATPDSIIVVDPLIDDTESRQRFITEPNITPPSSENLDELVEEEEVEEEEEKKEKIDKTKKRKEELSQDPTALGTSQDLSGMMEALAARTSGPPATSAPAPATAPLSPTLSTSSSSSSSASSSSASSSASSSVSQLLYSNHWKNIVSGGSSSPTKKKNNNNNNTTTSRSRRHSFSTSSREERGASHYAESDVTEDMLENAGKVLFSYISQYFMY